MGGTSTDISLVYDGEERVTKEWFVEYGYPICFPSIEVLTIGAGGGSLAWIDEAGSLRNGPQSAGANPGPGLLRPRQRPADEHRRQPRARPARRGADRRRHGARPRGRRARDRRRTSPSRSGSTLDEAADAIIQVANANMADAVRLISIRRGYDPREFASSPSAAPGRCTARRWREELVDPDGARAAEPRHHLGARLPARRRPPRPRRRCSWRTSTRSTRARSRRSSRSSRPRRASGSRPKACPRSRCRLQRLVDMRYLGQWRSLTVPVVAPRRRSTMPSARFHAEHEREYNYRRDGAPVEIYRLQRPRGRRDAEAGARAARAERRRRRAAGVAARPLRLDGRRRRRRRVYRARRPAGGREHRGPGDHRPARLDDARAARAGGRRSTSG